MSQTFPRLLVATEFDPNAAGGGPAVVRQMLKDWPVERLFWWSCLSGSEAQFGQKTAAHAVAAIPSKLYPHRRARMLKSWLLENIWTPWAAGHFERTLKEFKPEAIWLIPHQWAIPPLARVLLKSNLKYHVTMQDYMDTRARMQRFGIARTERWARMAEQLYAKAATRDATSHPMITDLLARTGCAASQMLHAGIEAEELSYLGGEMETDTERIRIAYAGTVMVEKEFEFFANVLERIRARLSRPLSFEFFGNHSYRDREWFKREWMNEHGNLAWPELSAALRDCTWGFSPMALNDDDPRYNRFSFPTKFVNYLVAGLPVITLGHPESAVVKTASEYQVGLCATSADPNELGANLLEVLSEPRPESKYRAEIQRCALMEFDAAKMRANLYEDFKRGTACGKS